MRGRRSTERLRACALTAMLTSGCAGYESHEVAPGVRPPERASSPSKDNPNDSPDDPADDGNPAKPSDAEPSGGNSAKADAPSPAGLNLSDIGKPVLIGSSFYFTEGPVWDPAVGVLYFTDINAHQQGPVNEQPDAGAAGDAEITNDAGAAADSGTPSPADQVGGAIYRLTPPDTIDVFLEPVGNANGLGLDPDGHLIAAGFVSRNVWRLSDSGQQEVFSPCASGGGTCYAEQLLNTPDDVAVRSDGTLYFTDPTFGSAQQGFPRLDLPLGNAQGIYRVDSDGKLWLEDKGTSGPNGVNLSPDEKTLYVSYTVSGQVVAFDIEKSGALSHKRTFATGALGADSMCVDADGNVYVGTLSGLTIFDPAGKNLGSVSVNGQIVTNCAFGGDDQRTLYITARGLATLLGAPRMGGSSLYAIDDMPVAGIPGQN